MQVLETGKNSYFCLICPFFYSFKILIFILKYLLIYKDFYNKTKKLTVYSNTYKNTYILKAKNTT